MQRREICRGYNWHYAVQCAVRADGTVPAGDFLDELAKGVWEPDVDAESLPDDEQITDRYHLLAKIKYLAEKGEPQRKHDVEYLREGIWEFKQGSKRVAFYATDGAGLLDDSAKILDIKDAPYAETPMWWFPEFVGRILRLANAWPKTGQKTPPDMITEATVIREEDLKHDRPE